MPARNWLDMSPEEFDTDPVMVQGALFPAPDPCGTDPICFQTRSEP